MGDAYGLVTLILKSTITCVASACDGANISVGADSAQAMISVISNDNGPVSTTSDASGAIELRLAARAVLVA